MCLFLRASGAQPNISQTVIRNLAIPVVPINAQRRIVARLKAQLAEVDALRAALEQQLRDVQALPQRLLAAAFAH